MPASVIPVTGLILGPVGSISQTDFPLTTPRLVNSSDTNIPAFGDTLVLNTNNTYSSVKQFIANSGTVTNRYTGIALAQANVKTNTVYPTTGSTASISSSGTYPAGSECDGLTRGTMNCAVTAPTSATPTAGQPVFIRTVANGTYPNSPIGGIEAGVDGVTPVATALAGNTGNATVGTLSLGTLPVAGNYLVVFTAATAYNVFDPTGAFVGTGATGTAFASTGVNFTITAGGTAMVRGDGFNIAASLKTVWVENLVFKTGILSTDPYTGLLTAQVAILNRKVS